jgi:sugar O-acyltransferase (sialic acid O-acetyltransferase NeuD family)
MRIAIFGPGGCGRDICALATVDAQEVIFVADKAGGTLLGLPILGIDALDSNDELVLAVGQPEVRERIANRLSAFKFKSLLAPTTIIGPDVEVGEGSIFCHFTMVTASVKIGRHFHCNIYSYIAHECVIGDFVTFSPRVSCNGNVHIGNGVFIGSGAVIRQGTPDKPLTIGAGATVGMGAVVTRDVAPGETVVGNPARAITR